MANIGIALTPTMQVPIDRVYYGNEIIYMSDLTLKDSKNILKQVPAQLTTLN